MKRFRTLIVLGTLVGISPFLGLPYEVLMWLLPILGVLVALSGIAASLGDTYEKTSQTHESPSSL